MFSSVHLKLDREAISWKWGRTIRGLFYTTWLLRDCTCSNSWFRLLHCHCKPFNIGGCYDNAAENCCDMTHNKWKKSRAAVMEYGALSVCVTLLQRGEMFFSFFQEAEGGEASGLLRATSPSKLTHVRILLAVFTCLFHAPLPRRPAVLLRRPESP